jgi:hypothetical protein
LTVKYLRGNFGVGMLAELSTQPYLILIAVGIIVAIPLSIGVFRRRQGIAYKLKNVIVGEASFVGVTLLMLKLGRTQLESGLAGFLVAVLLVFVFTKPRSRRIPESEKRKARARHELKTRRKFNPKKHEYDHRIPFSKLGNNTADNIRIVDKKVNRSKGAKSPWWDLLGK